MNLPFSEKLELFSTRYVISQTANFNEKHGSGSREEDCAHHPTRFGRVSLKTQELTPSFERNMTDLAIIRLRFGKTSGKRLRGTIELFLTSPTLSKS